MTAVGGLGSTANTLPLVRLTEKRLFSGRQLRRRNKFLEDPRTCVQLTRILP
jgi:hypothetical protein